MGRWPGTPSGLGWATSRPLCQYAGHSALTSQVRRDLGGEGGVHLYMYVVCICTCTCMWCAYVHVCSVHLHVHVCGVHTCTCMWCACTCTCMWCAYVYVCGVHMYMYVVCICMYMYVVCIHVHVCGVHVHVHVCGVHLYMNLQTCFEVVHGHIWLLSLSYLVVFPLSPMKAKRGVLVPFGDTSIGADG